jgi:RES domain
MANASGEEGELGDRRVCGNCIREEYLSALIRASNQIATCHYCDEESPTISIDEAGDHVERALDHHFERTPTEPEGYEYHIQRETGNWDRRGEPVSDVITSLLEADELVASDIRSVLDDRTSDPHSYGIGEEQPFEEDAHYVETSRVDHSELSEDYRRFEVLVTEEARYFSPETREILGRLFGHLEGLRTAKGAPVILEIGPDELPWGFFRARVFQDDGPLEKALMTPSSELGSPPPRKGRAGRLNAAGVSVFYGSDKEEIALAEVRPPVGSRAVVARFELLRNIRLLDLPALQSILADGSLFDPDFIGRLRSAAFCNDPVISCSGVT